MGGEELRLAFLITSSLTYKCNAFCASVNPLQMLPDIFDSCINVIIKAPDIIPLYGIN
jgi:hypothetical protein